MQRFQNISYPDYSKTLYGFLKDTIITSDRNLDQSTSNVLNSVSDYPNIQLNQILSKNVTKINSDIKSTYDLFLNEPTISEVISWYRNGRFDILKQISVNCQQKLIGKIARTILIISDTIEKFHINSWFSFGTNFKFASEFNKYSQTKDWISSPIRCISWHLYNTILALATFDDHVYLLIPSKGNVISVLKRPEQKSISCMAWRPFTDTELAIGCENGIIIWNMTLKAFTITNPTITNRKYLKYGNENFISCIDWSPNGDLLISTSLKSRSIVIWNVELEKYTALYSLRAGNILVSWAPNNIRLFTANYNLVFRIWDCYKWKSDHWNVPEGHVQTATWSPCGAILLFATSHDPFIYLLNFDLMKSVFQTNKEVSLKNARPIFDATMLDIGNNATIGGRIVSMKWDPQAKYIALIFSQSDFVAVLKTQLKPFLVLSSFVIWGKEGERANVIDFQKNYSNGACLTIGWSSSRLQHFPICDVA